MPTSPTVEEVREFAEATQKTSATHGGRAMNRCGIKHKFGDQTCCRESGHDGLCRSKAERGGGTITYSEWESRDGKFYSHVGYRTIYPANAK